MPSRTILIAGGALAGPAAAARAREIDESARIILIERGTRVSYAQCGLAYYLSGEVAAPADLNRERAEFFHAVYNVEVWTQVEVGGIDTAGRRLRIRRGGVADEVAYDALIVALGAASRRPPDVSATNLIGFRTLDDLEAIERAIASGARRVTILGAGPLGVEAADGLMRRGLEVTLLDRGIPLEAAGMSLASRFLDPLSKVARIVAGDTAARFDVESGRIVAIHTGCGKRIDTDLVIAALGLEPRTGLLRDAGAQLAEDGTVLVDERARTSLPDVYACGVCTSTPQAITGKPVWLAQGALADKTAQVAGANAAGGSARLAPATGSMLVRAGGAMIGRTGLRRLEAEGHFGVSAVARTLVQAPAVESYLSKTAAMTVEILWHRETGRLLGFDAVGTAGVDKRVDASAAAIAGGLTIDDLASLDFGYEPPVNAARDPLNVAATVARMERDGLVRPLTVADIVPGEPSPRIPRAQALAVDAGVEDRASLKAIPLEQLRSRLGELDRIRPVVTMCGTGRRALLAARILSQNGFGEVYYLAGGIDLTITGNGGRA